MAKGILGRKVGMTQVYDESGNALPVTVIEAGPCHVLQVRTVERDGYEAVQLGFSDKPRRLAIRSERGHVAKLSSKRSKNRAAGGAAAPAKADCEPKRFVRELTGPAGDLAVGTKLLVDVLKDVKAVDITGTSKGRGFAGVIKRHGFHGHRASHGTKKVHRQAGSTGMHSDPSRVFKGTKMPGHYGNERVTVRNLKIVRVDAENNLLLVYGGVPGPPGCYLVIRETNKVT